MYFKLKIIQIDLKTLSSFLFQLKAMKLDLQTLNFLKIFEN